jgi:phage tail-like protein
VPARTDPHPAFRFEVRLDGLASGGFCECGGLDSQIDVIEYREGGVNDHVHKFVTGARHGSLILRRGIVDRELYDWHAEVSAGKAVSRNGIVRVFDASASDVVMEWRFSGALPVKWSGPVLDALESRIAVEELELTHDGLKRTV